MRQLKINSFKEYLTYLINHKEEITKLINTITINVSKFFRDYKLFEKIENEVFPILFNKPNEFITIWSAGCAKGQETYSIAILAYDYKKRNNLNKKITVIGTDIDRECLNFAKECVYASSDYDRSNHYSIKYLSKYVTESEKSFIISPVIRSIVNFKESDLIHNNFPLMVDLILCRNVFIYFSRKLQEQIITRFYHSLSFPSYLALGKAETIVGMDLDIFELVDIKNRIYEKVRK